MHNVENFKINDICNGITLYSSVHQNFYNKHYCTILPKDMALPDLNHPEEGAKEEHSNSLLINFMNETISAGWKALQKKEWSGDTGKLVQEDRNNNIKILNNDIQHTEAQYSSVTGRDALSIQSQFTNSMNEDIHPKPDRPFLEIVTCCFYAYTHPDYLYFFLSNNQNPDKH
ncbi:hypothetical protein L218DRAFT_949553 [Marasmius fiardii PR-910]|nr:hypothetical protein L218DRAFT_949553 [Marasmius fiardii PR-910]